MMQRFPIVAGLLAASISWQGAAFAADNMRPSGTYVGAAAGLSIAGDTDYSGGGINAKTDHDNGWVGALSLGRAYGNGFRAEVEASMRRNGVDKISGANGTGRSQVLAGMVNGLYDFATGSAWVPYIGLGVGATKIDGTARPVASTSINDSDIGLAAQAIAGVGYTFDHNWTGSLEYRYFQTFGVGLKTASGINVDGDYSAHAIMAGLRYTFGEPAKKPMAEPAPKPMPVAQPAPPPPAPKPMPAPIARNYIVFFDWNKSTLTPEAMAILRSAAENAAKGGVSRIQATGHADRSGSDKYNLKLSEKRAKAVQAELGRLGIATSNVAVAFKGEREPLVQTADGVREPQNRRVEIVFP